MPLPRIFVDTGAWFALQVTDDRHHRPAKDALPELLSRFRSLVTTNHVIGETFTLLRMAKGYAPARAFLDVLDRSPRLERYFVTPDLEREAMALLHRYVVMRKETIQQAFAFDRHFSIAGFTRIPEG